MASTARCALLSCNVWGLKSIGSEGFEQSVLEACNSSCQSFDHQRRVTASREGEGEGEFAPIGEEVVGFVLRSGLLSTYCLTGF